MFAIFTLAVLVALAGAQTCSKHQDDCLASNGYHLCPNGQVCFVDKTNDKKSFCCLLTDVVNIPATAAPSKDCYDKHPNCAIGKWPASFCTDPFNLQNNIPEEYCPKRCGYCK